MPSAKQVAVLPLTIVGGDAETAAFGAGLTETVTAKLTQLTGDPLLQVVPATEISAKHVTTVDEARKEFGAGPGKERVAKARAPDERKRIDVVTAA